MNQVSESVETYSTTTSVQDLTPSAFTMFFSSNDLLIIQANDIIREQVGITLHDLRGNEVAKGVLTQGSTISHIDCSLLYDGVYAARVSSGNTMFTQELLIKRK